MTRDAIIYDTNAYRSVGMKNVEVLRAAERAEGMVPLVAVPVVLELMARSTAPALATTPTDAEDLSANPRDIGSAWSGLRALVVHAQVWDGSAGIPLVRSALAHLLRNPKSEAADARNIATLHDVLLQVTAKEDCPTDGERYFRCQEALTYVLHSERRYGHGIWEATQRAWELYRNLGFAENDIRRAAAAIIRRGGAEFGADLLARILLDRCGVSEPSEPAMRDAIAQILSSGPVAAHFLTRQLELSAGGQIDPRQPKHRNSHWDAEICALIHADSRAPNDSMFHGASITVVTTEAQVLRSAEAASMRASVRSLGEHARALGLIELAAKNGWT